MPSHIAQWTLDVHDVALMARFWSEALGYRIDKAADGNVHLLPPEGAPPASPTIWLQPTGATKRNKLRGHIDLAIEGDPAAEVERLLALGARRADVGQTGSEPFTVLVDPEGNEFCLLDRPPAYHR
ncbi:VOC family protein [Micromonospora sp. CPCC 206061]|uniref:VOC family protein n=1 Tax=Micromonospora sp. CPCC 206061 TaxID=3122410 RepID=UPI002FEF0087